MDCLLTGVEFVKGWQRELFVAKWSMHQLVTSKFESQTLPMQCVPLLVQSSGSGSSQEIRDLGCNFSVFLQLIECPSVYELMAHPEFDWEEPPELRLWRKRVDDDGTSIVSREAFGPNEYVTVMMEALKENTVSEYLRFALNLALLQDLASLFSGALLDVHSMSLYAEISLQFLRCGVNFLCF